MKIWRCPLCQSGLRAPERMRMDNALRYCLVCTEKTGKLVQRTCPSKDTRRERLEAARKEADAKRKAASAARREAYYKTPRGQLDQAVYRYLKLDAFRGFLGLGPFKTVLEHLVMFTIRMGSGTASTGRAYPGERRFVVTAGSDVADAHATIIHEIAHLVTSLDEGHGDAWRSVFADAVFEVTGERPSGKSRYDIHDAAIACMRRFLGDAAITVAQPADVVTITPGEQDADAEF